jgi:hypothetical protein
MTRAPGTANSAAHAPLNRTLAHGATHLAIVARALPAEAAAVEEREDASGKRNIIRLFYYERGGGGGGGEERGKR